VSEANGHETRARWVPCEDCEEFWCLLHCEHAFSCPCPPVDELGFDPYSEGGP